MVFLKFMGTLDKVDELREDGLKEEAHLQEIPQLVPLNPGLFQNLDQRPDRKIPPVHWDNSTPFQFWMKIDPVAPLCPVEDKALVLNNLYDLLRCQPREFKYVHLP
jgi:hypothetical protein